MQLIFVKVLPPEWQFGRLENGGDELSKWRNKDGVFGMMILDYGGSISQVLHTFNLSLYTILVHLSLIANFTLLFSKISKIL